MAVEYLPYMTAKFSVFPEVQIPFITFLLHTGIFWLQKTNSTQVV